MKTKYFLSFFTILLTMILIILLCGCNTNIDTSTYDELNLIGNDSQNYLTDYSEISKETQQDDEEEYKINKTNIVDLNTKISKEGIEYSNIKIYKSKKLPLGVTEKDFDYFDIDFDKSEKLREDVSYMFITIDVQNTNSKNIDLCWENISPFLIEDKGDYYYNLAVENAVPWETRYRSGSNVNVENIKDYYMQNLKANTSTTVTIGYLIDDKYIDDLRLCIVPESCNTSKILEYKFMNCVMINK